MDITAIFKTCVYEGELEHLAWQAKLNKATFTQKAFVCTDMSTSTNTDYWY